MRQKNNAIQEEKDYQAIFHPKEEPNDQEDLKTDEWIEAVSDNVFTKVCPRMGGKTIQMCERPPTLTHRRQQTRESTGSLSLCRFITHSFGT